MFATAVAARDKNLAIVEVLIVPDSPPAPKIVEGAGVQLPDTAEIDDMLGYRIPSDLRISGPIELAPGVRLIGSEDVPDRARKFFMDEAELADLPGEIVEMIIRENEHDDMLVGKERAEWDRIIAAYKPAAEQPIVLDPKVPTLSAAAFVKSRYELPGGAHTLACWQGAFYRWTGTHYAEIDEAAIRAELYKFLETAYQAGSTGSLAPFAPNRNKIGDTLDALRALVNVQVDIRPPEWLGGKSEGTRDLVSCQNGLLAASTRQLFPHSAAFFTLNALEFAYLPGAPPPSEWERFLHSIWPSDNQAISTLQEVFGYLLAGDTRQQKAFLIVGPKRSGKGTVARVLARLLGLDNVAGPTLASLAQQFGLAPIIGKRVAIISDARLGNKADQHAIAERLLAISGEDMLTVDRKYRSPWTGRLGARFLILSNETPRLADASGALASRFIVLTLRESFFGREDHGLTERLIRELPGILNWALDGWERLSTRGHFVPPASSNEAIEELEDLGSPIGAFIKECCAVDVAKSVETTALYDRWKGWCLNNGRERPGTLQSFGRDLRAAVPTLRLANLRVAGAQRRFYHGIGLP